MTIADDGMAMLMSGAMSGLRRLAGLEVLDRFNLRDRVEQFVGDGARAGFSAGTAAARTFTRVSRSVGATPARQRPRSGGGDLFDLTPDEEQQMLVAALSEMAAEHMRPAARQADDDQATADKILEMATEMGVLILGVPSELGGVVDERSAVTGVLAMEALAHGDMGQTAAAFAPAAVSSALALWGDAEQQATYLTPFTGEDAPVAALAIAEPRPLFDPFDLRTTARRDGDGFVLDGVKAMVARIESCSLYLLAAHLEGTGPALFIVESGTPGLAVRREPTMGVRAAGCGELLLSEVRVPSSALLAGASPDAYADAVARTRIAWAALAMGTGRAVLDYVIPYVNERHAFGTPISHRQSVAFMVSDIAIELEGLRLATLRAASLADQGKPFARAAAVAHQIAASKGMEIGSSGVQLLGGHGYVKEHPVERWYRDLRAAGMTDGLVLV